MCADLVVVRSWLLCDIIVSTGENSFRPHHRGAYVHQPKALRERESERGGGGGKRERESRGGQIQRERAHKQKRGKEAPAYTQSLQRFHDWQPTNACTTE